MPVSSSPVRPTSPIAPWSPLGMPAKSLIRGLPEGSTFMRAKLVWSSVPASPWPLTLSEVRTRCMSGNRLPSRKPSAAARHSGRWATKSVKTSKKPPAPWSLSDLSYAAGANDGGEVESDCSHAPLIASGP